MKQDFKIGMLVGLAVLVVLLVGWVLLRGRPGPQSGYARTQNPGMRTMDPNRMRPAGSMANPQPYGAAPTASSGAAPVVSQGTGTEPNAASSQLSAATLPAPTPAPAASATQVQPAPAPVATTAKPARTHTVVEGETLSDIADHYYGTSDQWTKIYRANRSTLKDPDRINPGMKLVIPD
jgi:nucleoid-associated protein YgaU